MQLQRDKIINFGAGIAAASFVALFVHMVAVASIATLYLFGVGAGLVAGGLKEQWDKNRSNHTLGGWDAYWTVAGAVFAMTVLHAYRSW